MLSSSKHTRPGPRRSPARRNARSARATPAAIAAGAALVAIAMTSGCSDMRAAIGMSAHPYSSDPTFGVTPTASAVASAAPEETEYSIRPASEPPPSAESLSGGQSTPVVPASDASQDVPPKLNVFGELNDGAAETRSVANVPSGEATFQQHTFVDEGFDSDVSVDPKGQWLVFASTRHAEHADIYLQRVDGVAVTQLTSDDADDAFPVFSPDGSKIAFCSTRTGNWDIFVMDRDGKNVVQVTTSPTHDVHPSFSPDGSHLVYSSLSRRSGQWELWTADLTSGERKMIGFGLLPSWSPSKDKNVIAFQRARSRGSRWFSLWTLELVDGEARNVTEVAMSTNAAIVSPAWSPDGQRIGFATIVEPAKESGGSGKRPRGQQDIWTINADGTDRRRITDGTGTSATPFWAANNRVFFVSNRGGNECVWSAKVQQGSNISTANVETGEVQH